MARGEPSCASNLSSPRRTRRKWTASSIPWVLVTSSWHTSTMTFGPPNPFAHGRKEWGTPASLTNYLLHCTNPTPDITTPAYRATVKHEDWTLPLCASKSQTYHGFTMTLSACPCGTVSSPCLASDGVREARSPSHHRRSGRLRDGTPPPFSEVHNPNGYSGIQRYTGTPSRCSLDPERHLPGSPPTTEKEQRDNNQYMARHLLT